MRQCPTCTTVYREDQNFCSADGAALVPYVSADPHIGAVVAGSYRLRRRMGTGGFGVVYEADHARLPMRVAVKLIHPARRHDEEFMSRFAQEAEALALTQHPNVVRVLDHGVDPDVGLYMVLEHLEGRDLAQMLDGNVTLGALEMCAIIDQTAAGLEAAHRMGVLHRDVKAENVVLATDASRPEGFCVKLIDFGLARLVDRPELARSPSARSGRHRSSASMRLGSPATMPPEVALANPADHRADIYSLGAVVFELLTRHMLFSGRDLADMLYRIVHTPPPPMAELVGGAWVPPEVEDLVRWMLDKDPERRPQSMTDLRRAFSDVRTVLERAWADAHLVSQEPATARELAHMMAGSPRRVTPLGYRARPLVLAVDDDAVARNLMARTVRAAGCDCETRESAQAALEWLSEHPAPDALLLDVIMPGVDGLSLAAAVRESGFCGPVVFCTGAATEAVRERTAQIGGSWCLDKSMDLHRVPEILRRAGVRAVA